MQIQNISYINNKNYTIKRQPKSSVGFNALSQQSKFFSFVSKPYDKLTDKIAFCLAKVIKNNKFQKLVENTVVSKTDILKHLSVVVAALISGMYVQRTLSNNKLDKDKRTTLAINQATVFFTATAGGYLVDGMINKQVTRFINRFLAIHSNKSLSELAIYSDGLKAAKSLVIFGLMYRYISPVLVTPIANAIGNKVNENRKNKVS